MRKTKHIIIISVSLFLALSVALSIVAVFKLRADAKAYKAACAPYNSLVASEKEYIMSCQHESGAFMLYKTDNEQNTVNPYFASIAARGLLAGTITAKQAESVARYASWYIKNINENGESQDGNGTISDFSVSKNGVIKNTGKYDSADSYAAEFIILSKCCLENEAVKKLLPDNFHKKLLLIINFLTNSVKENGLSVAKADYPVQYLMDNCEVNEGLKAAKEMLSKHYCDANSSAILNIVSAKLKANSSAIESLLYDSAAHSYYIGILNGKPMSENEEGSFYPGGVGQLFPVLCSVTSPKNERGSRAYKNFCIKYDFTNMSYRKSSSSGYWCLLSYACAKYQDQTNTDRFFQKYRSVVSSSRKYPLNISDAGWIIMACVLTCNSLKSEYILL